MSSDAPLPPEPAETHRPPDMAHLDEDAECLEDPVHCGDAHHQHDVRATAVPPQPPPTG